MDQAVVMLAFVLPVIFLAGGVLVILMGMYQYQKKVEMKHRERLAMIERGLAPGPEHDPGAFESWQHRHEQQPPAKSTSVGVVIVALGLGLMLLIGFAAETPSVAVGVGGAIVVVGAAFIVNGELQRRSRPPMHTTYTTAVPSPPPPPRPPDRSDSEPL